MSQNFIIKHNKLNESHLIPSLIEKEIQTKKIKISNFPDLSLKKVYKSLNRSSL